MLRPYSVGSCRRGAAANMSTTTSGRISRAGHYPEAAMKLRWIVVCADGVEKRLAYLRVDSRVGTRIAES